MSHKYCFNAIARRDLAERKKKASGVLNDDDVDV